MLKIELYNVDGIPEFRATPRHIGSNFKIFVQYNSTAPVIIADFFEYLLSDRPQALLSQSLFLDSVAHRINQVLFDGHSSRTNRLVDPLT